MRNLIFSVLPDVTALGVKILTARITAVQNSETHTEFESFRDQKLQKIKDTWDGKNYKDDPILAGFRDLHTKVGRSNRDYVASPEGLRWLYLERGRFPHINTLVDIYNLISLKSGLALGAHDIDYVSGNVTLRLTKGDEVFIPLGKTEPVSIFPGEYGYVDDGNNVICRMEVLQVEPTKTTVASKDIFMIIQGNPNTSSEYVEEIAKEACELITKFCGGSYELLNSI